MTVTLLLSQIDSQKTIHGVYADRKRALKVLRYIFEREKRYRRRNPKTYLSEEQFEYYSKIAPCLLKETPYWRNERTRNEFVTDFETFWLETYEVKK